MKEKNWIYQRGQFHAQTVTYEDAQGIERAAYTSGRAFPGAPDYEVAEYLAILNFEREPGTPEFEALPWETVSPLIEAGQEAAFVTPWQEIDEEKYDYYLCVLPPEKWENCNGVSLFRMSEYTTGNITQHCAAYRGRFFARTCPNTIKYDTLAAEVLALCSQPVAA